LTIFGRKRMLKTNSTQYEAMLKETQYNLTYCVLICNLQTKLF